MRTVFIAFRLLWKRRFANLALLLQLLLSIIMLAQLFVFIVDHQDSIRAVNELPIKNTMVLSVYEYYTMEYVSEQVLSSPMVDAVGKVYMSGLTCNNTTCNLAVYSDSIIARYSPKLQSGVWLSDCQSADPYAIPAVISGDIGLNIGDTISTFLENGNTCRIRVVGILQKPTQYLYPSGSASPAYFTASSVISQDPVVILRDTDFGDASVLEPALGLPVAKNLFVFMKPDRVNEGIDMDMRAWSRYGEVTPMTSLVSTYNEDTKTLIDGGTAMFIVFLLLAVTGVLSNHVIQSLHNRSTFTIYYMLGMDWKKSAVIEMCRVTILMILTMFLSVVAGKAGLLMLQYMTPTRRYLFFGVAFLYIIVMFAAIGARFIHKLIHTDIATSLKDLRQGE